MSWDEAEKSSLSLFSFLFFSFIHACVAGEAVLPNNFIKTAQLYLESRS